MITFRTSAPTLAVCLMAFASIMQTPVRAEQPAFESQRIQGVAIGGYDVVAYIHRWNAVPGDPAITLEQGGVTWRFAEESHRDMFKSNPDLYAPQFGGYCAYSLGTGVLAPADPTTWSIDNGMLFLFSDSTLRTKWQYDMPTHYRKAFAKWPAILKK